MARQVVTQDDVLREAVSGPPRAALKPSSAAAPAAARTGTAPKADDFTDRLIKYIPTEVVAVYVFVEGLIRTAPGQVPRKTLEWIVFGVLLVGTWFYLRRLQNVTKTAQLIISTVAFAVWVFSIGGPFATFAWYAPIYGAILLPLYTFVIPIVGGKRQA